MNESMNKILVLGNGFDLAHYLPTKYDHFMTAMQAIVKSKNKEIDFDELFADYLKDDADKNEKERFQKSIDLYQTDKFILSEDVTKVFKGKLENNSWFRYFSKYLENVETWIDFESEIERVLGIFVDIFNMFRNNIINIMSIYENNILSSDILDENKGIIDLSFISKINKKDIYIDLLYEFGFLERLYVVCEYHKIFGYEDYNLHKKEIVNEIVFSETQTYEGRGLNSWDKCSKRKNCFTRIINKDILKKYKSGYTSLDEIHILKFLSNQLNDFKEIFSLYISEIIDKLQPKKPFIAPKCLDNGLSAVFTFNYSESFQRFYDIKLGLIDKVQHLHGNAKVNNIVLGIDDLNDELKPYKIYYFVKTHQKIINDTDYQFLDDEKLTIKQLHIGGKLYNSSDFIPYKIIIWGHSLDISDKEYIQDIFRLNLENSMHEVTLEIWYYGTPHTSLANLIHIMGKDIVQNWVKKGWLKFEKVPDIYALNK